MGEIVRQLNIRIPETIVQGLDEIAYREQIDRTTLARKMLTEGIQRWRIEYAIASYQRGEITKARAAELANVSIYDILDEVRQRGITPGYTLDELRQDLASLGVTFK
jgi:predicted HTH domain antitoxin